MGALHVCPHGKTEELEKAQSTSVYGTGKENSYK
jgi:hypothetical protein